jgi:hypothetical protein
MGGFTDPEDFFLNFREALVAALDSDIAAGNRDTERERAHGQPELGWANCRRLGEFRFLGSVRNRRQQEHDSMTGWAFHGQLSGTR